MGVAAEQAEAGQTQGDDPVFLGAQGGMRGHVIARFGRLVEQCIEVAVFFCPLQCIGPDLGQLLDRGASGILQVCPVERVPEPTPG